MRRASSARPIRSRRSTRAATSSRSQGTFRQLHERSRSTCQCTATLRTEHLTDEWSTDMRKLIVHEFMSLDGVMQAPGGKDEDLDGGFQHGGWTIPYWHDDIGANFFAMMQEVDAFL